MAFNNRNIKTPDALPVDQLIASLRESHAHGITITQEAPNYSLV
jgi:hypothetical protein